MRVARNTLSIFVSAILLCACQGVLPNISHIEQKSEEAQAPPVIVGPGGELSPSQTAKSLAELQRKGAPADLIRANISLMEFLGSPPLTMGNRVTLLVDGAIALKAISKAIAAARDHVNIETFIFDDDETGQRLADLLIRKQKENVQVNLIYDSVGCIGTPSAFFQRMKDAGVNVLEFNPVDPIKAKKAQLLSNRDHRKIVVVDGKVAFTGGVNLSGVYSRSYASSGASDGEKGWRDTHIKVSGPCVADFQRLFIQTWQNQKGPALAARNYFPVLKTEGEAYVEVVGSTPGELNRLTFIMYVSAIRHAANFVHLTTAYFIPDRQFLHALAEAAGKGVEVKVVLPGTSDSKLAFYAGRSHYEDLLEAGVRLYERRERMLHAKTATIDGIWATVGSTNLDQLSFRNNNEINAIILDQPFSAEMENLFKMDIAASDEISRGAWSRRSVWERMKETFSRLFSGVL